MEWTEEEMVAYLKNNPTVHMLAAKFGLELETAREISTLHMRLWQRMIKAKREKR